MTTENDISGGDKIEKGISLRKTAARISIREEADSASPEGSVAETPDHKLRKRTLTPLVWFYIISNAIIDVGVFVFALIERSHQSFGEHIITANVVIALIGGNTVQISAMIIAAFKGLFDSKTTKAKDGKRKSGKKPKTAKGEDDPS